MNNKETLQNNNSRLNENNVDLTSLLNEINNLPEVKATDYQDLSNKPQINGVELTGNKTSKELGITGETPLEYIKTINVNATNVQIIEETFVKKYKRIFITTQSEDKSVDARKALTSANVILFQFFDEDNNSIAKSFNITRLSTNFTCNSSRIHTFDFKQNKELYDFKAIQTMYAGQNISGGNGSGLTHMVGLANSNKPIKKITLEVGVNTAYFTNGINLYVYGEEA